MGTRRIIWSKVVIVAALGLLLADLSYQSASAQDIVLDPLTENYPDHDDPNDYLWDSTDVIPITLNGDAIVAADGAGATVDGSTLTIRSAGTYSLSGALTDGQIVVDSKDDAPVRLILSGIDISCSSSAPVYIKNAQKAIIVLAEETENHVVDARVATSEDFDASEPNAVIFSKENLTLCGSGGLTVVGDVNDGISSKDGLVIAGGIIDVNVVDDGIRGKDYLVVRGGTITIDAGGDGLKSDEDQDATKGYISIEGGALDISSEADAIQAATDVTITGERVTLTSGGGSRNRRGVTISAKGIKAGVSILIDGGNMSIDSADDAIHADGALSINGGLLTLSSRADALHSGATVEINGGDINIDKCSEGIDGVDITIKDGDLAIVSNDDGIHATECVSITYGIIDITAATDAIEAETDLTIADGEIILSSGGGSSGLTGSIVSAKGVKGGTNVLINGGNLTIDSADDAVHSNATVTINGGVLAISTKDDGIHANTDLVINEGQIDIAKSYEGLESTDADITINGGNLHIVSTDDGVNIAGGGDGFGMGGPGRPGQRPGDTQSTSDCCLYVNGGYIAVEAGADGIDINGSVVMTDGTVLVNGPTANMNGALDYDASFQVTGGYLLAVGSSGMAQAPGTGSTQYSVLVNLRSTLPAGTLFHIQARDGEDILTFAPAKSYQSVAFSCAALTEGATYDICYGGSTTGQAKDGLYEGGTYTPGTRYGSFTITSVVTNVR